MTSILNSFEVCAVKIYMGQWKLGMLICFGFQSSWG